MSSRGVSRRRAAAVSAVDGALSTCRRQRLDLGVEERLHDPAARGKVVDVEGVPGGEGDGNGLEREDDLLGSGQPQAPGVEILDVAQQLRHGCPGMPVIPGEDGGRMGEVDAQVDDGTVLAGGLGLGQERQARAMVVDDRERPAAPHQRGHRGCLVDEVEQHDVPSVEVGGRARAVGGPKLGPSAQTLPSRPRGAEPVGVGVVNDDAHTRPPVLQDTTGGGLRGGCAAVGARAFRTRVRRAWPPSPRPWGRPAPPRRGHRA